MGSTSLLTRTLEWVSTERSLRNLAYDIVRVIASPGVGPPIEAVPPERRAYPLAGVVMARADRAADTRVVS